jgi:hypothetical protein
VPTGAAVETDQQAGFECEQQIVSRRSVMPTRAARNQISSLSEDELFSLQVASHYKLRRSSMGWWAENHPRWGVSEPVVILDPVTIKALWQKGLLGADVDEVPFLWTNEHGKQILKEIERATGMFYDTETDRLVPPWANSRSQAVH